MSLPPLPPPPSHGLPGPPPLSMGGPGHMASFPSGPPGMPSRPPTQVLLVDVPLALHNSRALRELLLPCGTARSILFVPPSPGPNEQPKEINGTIMALITLSHSDAALRVVSALKQLTKQSNDEAFPQTFQAHLVPTNPDIPLPPAMMDPATVQVLADKLQQAFDFIKRGEEQTNTTVVSEVSVEQPDSTTNKENTQEGDDEDADPLKAPEVLKLVQEFRIKLEKQQGTKAVRRKDLVRQRLDQMLPIMRQRIKEEQEKAISFPVPPSRPDLGLNGPPGLPPPPPPPGAAGLPLPPGAPSGMAPPAAQRAPRGVSNLPAWMTAQQQQPTESSEPQPKKLKPSELDSFPAIPGASYPALREFIASQIRHYLGEEEATLIDFIFNHVTAQKSTETLLPELKDVFEEDAQECLQAILAKTVELANL